MGNLFSYFQDTNKFESIEIGADLGRYLAIFFALILFGIGFNALIAHMERRGYLEGYVSLLVALGVMVTLIGAALVNLEGALIALVCFIASGLPMIIGSVTRYMRQRAAEQDSIKNGE